MIGLKRISDSESVLIKPDSNISLEFNNPCFDEQYYMQGEYSLPFDLPYKGNARAFDFIHHALRKFRQRVWPGFRLLYKGTEVAAATIDINSVNNDTINASLRLNFSSMKCINTKLSYFDYGPDVDMGADIFATLNATANEVYPTVKFNFPPIYNPSFYGEGSECVNTDYQGVMNDVDAGYASWSYFDNLSTNRNTIVPQIFLHHILKCGFAYDGYILDETVGFMANPTHQQILVYNNRAIDKLEYVSPQGMKASATNSPIWTKISGEHTILWNNDSTNGNYDALNAYDTATGHYTIAATGTHTIVVNLKTAILKNTNPSSTDRIIATLYFNGTILAQEDLSFNGVPNPIVSFSQTFTAVAGDIGSDLYVNLQYMNSASNVPYLKLLGTSYWSINDFAAGTKNVFKRFWNMADHVPDITFGHLLNEIKKAFCLSYKFDHKNKKVKILYFDDLLAQAPVNVQNESLQGHQIKFDPSNIYKILNYDFGNNDQYSSNSAKNYQQGKSMGESYTVAGLPAVPTGNYIYIPHLHQIWVSVLVGGVNTWTYFSEAYYDFIANPEGSVENRAACGPLFTKYTTLLRGAINYEIIYPCINQKGSSDEFGLADNPYDLRIMLWHGVSNNFSTQVMPMATCTNINKSGVRLGYGLHWAKDHNMHWWEKFLEITGNGETIVKKIKLKFHQFSKFDISDLWFWDNNKYIAKKVSLTIADDIQEAEFEVYKATIEPTSRHER